MIHKTVQYSNTLHIFSRQTSCLLHFDDSITYIISTQCLLEMSTNNHLQFKEQM